VTRKGLKPPNTAGKGCREYVAVTPRGSKGVFYSWSVRLDVTVDQRSEIFSFGSEAAPLHSWFGHISAAIIIIDLMHPHTLGHRPSLKDHPLAGSGAHTTGKGDRLRH
jgi:hypothetical protein